LAQHAIILGPGSLSGHWSFRKGGTATSLQVEGKLTIRVSLGGIAAAVKGLGILMTPLGACRWELERGELIRLLPEWDAGTVELSAVYASGRAAKPSARAFVDYLIAALRETELPPSDPPSIGENPRPRGRAAEKHDELAPGRSLPRRMAGAVIDQHLPFQS
jgi:DNA-binding transcriptional LysR family regulator